MSRPVRVLLLWPGSEGAAAGNFGVPQLVLLGTVLRARADVAVEVEIRDLAIERRLGTSLSTIIDGDDGRGYDVVAISVYSSFDHLPCGAIAELVEGLRRGDKHQHLLGILQHLLLSLFQLLDLLGLQTDSLYSPHSE